MLKKILLGFAGLLILLIVALGVLIARFDPNQYKDTITGIVKEKKQRTLKIDGDMKLSLWPKLGLDLGRISLSEHASEKLFASVDQAHLSVAVWPLLRSEVVIDQIVLDGLKASLVRDKEGHLNTDDLAAGNDTKAADKNKAAEPSGGKAAKFDVAGIRIDNANVSYLDEGSGKRYALSKLSLHTGEISAGQPVDLDLKADIESSEPKAAVNLALKGTLQADPATRKYGVNKLDLSLTGTAADIRNLKLIARGDALFDQPGQRIETSDFTLSASGSQGEQSFEMELAAPKLAIGPQGASGSPITGSAKLGGQGVNLKFNASPPTGNASAIRIAKLGLEFTQKQGERETSATFASAVNINLAGPVIDLPAMNLDIAIKDPALPKKSARIPLSGKVHADLGKQDISAELQGKFDDTNLRATLAVAGLKPPAIKLDINIDTLNVDQYLPPPSTKAGAPAAASGPEKPIDLSVLNGINVNASLHAGKLQVHNIKVGDLAVVARVAGGRLEVPSLSANLYQGTLKGSAVVSASHQFTIRQELSNIAIGPLMKDALDKDLIEGRGNVSLDLNTHGTTVSALKSALGGSASLKLRDGAIKGINLAQTLRDFKSKLGLQKNQAQGGDPNAKTDFSELSASFTISNGVASNRDLSAKSPFLRLTGAGEIDVGKDSMDYLAKAMVVNTTTGQDGKAMAQLKDVTVPVRIVGPFSKLAYEVQWAAISSDALKAGLLNRLTGNKDAAPATPGASPEKPADKLRQQMKGLLGR